MEQRLTKKELKERKKLEQVTHMQEGNSTNKMKWIVITVASVLFLGFFAFAIIASKQKALAPVKLSSSGWVTGNPKSKVVVTEFGDFQCPACGAFEPTFQQVIKDYGKKVKIVFKQFPLKSVHPNGMAAAIASEAAGKQGKFWQYHDLLYASQQEWSALPDPTDQFVSYAKSLKLNTDVFKKDLSSKNLNAKIDAQENEGIQIGVNSTPTVFINGVLQENRDYTALKKELDKELGK